MKFNNSHNEQSLSGTHIITGNEKVAAISTIMLNRIPDLEHNLSLQLFEVTEMNF